MTDETISENLAKTCRVSWQIEYIPEFVETICEAERYDQFLQTRQSNIIFTCP